MRYMADFNSKQLIYFAVGVLFQVHIICTSGLHPWSCHLTDHFKIGDISGFADKSLEIFYSWPLKQRRRSGEAVSWVAGRICATLVQRYTLGDSGCVLVLAHNSEQDFCVSVCVRARVRLHVPSVFTVVEVWQFKFISLHFYLCILLNGSHSWV